MHVGVQIQKPPVVHRGKAYPADLKVKMPWGREDDGQWEEVGAADMYGNMSYEFDEVRVYRHKFFGGLLIVHDSGCSCPSPFEDTTVEDGKFLNSLVEFDEFIDQYAGTESHFDDVTRETMHRRYAVTVDQVARLRGLLEEAIPAQPTYLDEGPTDIIEQ